MKQLWRDLKRTPGLLIALLVGGAILLWYIWKQNNAGGTNTTGQGEPTFELDTVSVTPPPPGPPVPPGPKQPWPWPKPPGPPTPGQPSDFEATHFKSSGSPTSGAGIYDKPGGKVTRRAKWGSAVDITGLATNVKGVDYYPIKGGGYARERDLVGLG